ncbi:MAG: lasso peptide biosynthesis PqqD family chaperone, partial [Actinomycetota bacterium]|nr:lasso peptide biosynthesis PqqD family chaperone [Actinomycetota bacterium]
FGPYKVRLFKLTEKAMTLKLRNGVSMTEVDYGTVLLDEERGQYWNLNPTGALILQTLLGDGTADQAARALVEQYAVEVDTASLDVQQLVEELCSAGLIEK